MLHFWVRNGYNSFIHRRLYDKGMPMCLQDAFTTLATYVSRTPAIKETILQIAEWRSAALASQGPCAAGGAQGIRAQLARIHALFAYQFILLFDGSVRSRAHAEKQQPTLRQWVVQICQAAKRYRGEDIFAQNNYPPHGTVSKFDREYDASSKMWQLWILIESVRRSQLIIDTISNIYDVMTKGWADCAGAVMFTARGGLWEADSAVKWVELSSGEEPLLVPSLQPGPLISQHNADEFDDLIKVIWTCIIGRDKMKCWIDKSIQALLDAFYNRGYRDIDTGRNYPGSEERLGRAGAASRFIIHTKVKDGLPGSHEPAKIEQSIKLSLEELKTPSVETMYLHVPDRQTSIEDAAKAINEGVKQGKYKRFGLSNYTEDEVQKFIDVAEEKGYAKPDLYQGHYNALVRGGEKTLFPLLRKHNISFFAYSPAAGGIFTGNAGKSTTSSRWKDDNQIGRLYSAVYGQPPVQASVDVVRAAAEKYGISGHAAALRWTTFHSILDGKYGDGVVFGVSNLDQLKKTLGALEDGPLPAELADAIGAVYATVEGSGPPYHL
ncbi:putative aldo/keto reductase [Daldinia vernicosa]|uniref:putative aldo/keto reductase n=1 Tax=Daldinia vernicosa TaxID=114800 RepID=UPI002007D1E5|nr:putative aldo/keto reductase [Daldinia vernicosa]KAI0849667.1 putative aldo/keto reductase [Daldinia vernicosa]